MQPHTRRFARGQFLSLLTLMLVVPAGRIQDTDASDPRERTPQIETVVRYEITRLAERFQKANAAAANQATAQWKAHVEELRSRIPVFEEEVSAFSTSAALVILSLEDWVFRKLGDSDRFEKSDAYMQQLVASNLFEQAETLRQLRGIWFAFYHDLQCNRATFLRDIGVVLRSAQLPLPEDQFTEALQTIPMVFDASRDAFALEVQARIFRSVMIATGLELTIEAATFLIIKYLPRIVNGLRAASLITTPAGAPIVIFSSMAIEYLVFSYFDSALEQDITGRCERFLHLVERTGLYPPEIAGNDAATGVDYFTQTATDIDAVVQRVIRDLLATAAVPLEPLKESAS